MADKSGRCAGCRLSKEGGGSTQRSLYLHRNENGVHPGGGHISLFIQYLLPGRHSGHSCWSTKKQTSTDGHRIQGSGGWIREAPEGNCPSLHPRAFRVQPTEPRDLLEKLRSPHSPWSLLACSSQRLSKRSRGGALWQRGERAVTSGSARSQASLP